MAVTSIVGCYALLEGNCYFTTQEEERDPQSLVSAVCSDWPKSQTQTHTHLMRHFMSCVLCLKGAIKFTFVIIISLMIINYVRLKKSMEQACLWSLVHTAKANTCCKRNDAVEGPVDAGNWFIHGCHWPQLFTIRCASQNPSVFQIQWYSRRQCVIHF